MKILDKEIEYNLTNVDNMEVLKKAIEDVKEKTNSIDKSDYISSLKQLCQIIRDCFKTVFNDKEVLPKENDYVLLMQAFTDLCVAFASTQQDANDKFQKVITKYKIG